MLYLKSFQIHGTSVQDVLDDLIERSTELGIEDIKKDIVSISVLRPLGEHHIYNPKAGTDLANIEVIIIAWVNKK